jgi:hypothetical protein
MLQIKVKISVSLIRYHIIKAYGGVEVELHSYFTSALDGGKWLD